jgi:CheY-like chemotaxis protein
MCELEPTDAFNRNQLLCREELLRDRLSKAGGVAAGPHMLQVLVVGDERTAADELAGRVDSWGYAVRLAYDGVTALRVAAAQQPDVVLLDVSLPLEDGCQLAQQLRIDLPRAKSFIITAVAMRPDAECFEQCCAAGIDLLLVKPVDPSVMETLLMLESEHVNRLHVGDAAEGASRLVTQSTVSQDVGWREAETESLRLSASDPSGQRI